LTSYGTGAQTTWVATMNAKPGADVSLTASRSLNSLNLTSGRDVALATRYLNIYSGGLLKSGATASYITYTSGYLTAGGTAAGELLTHVDSGSSLVIIAVVANNASGGAVTVVKAGAGTLELSGANTYTGGTVINAGTLLMSTNRTALGTGALTINGGELQAKWGNAANSTISSITITNGTIRRTYTGNLATAMIAGSGALTVAGPAQLIDQGGDGTSGYLRFDGPVNINAGGTLTLNAVTTSDEVRFDSATAQNITIAAGGSLVTTGVGTKNFGTTTARNFIGQGTSVADASFLVGSNTTYLAGDTITINGSGIGGLRVEGSINSVDNFLTTARVQGLAGSDGTLTIAYTNQDTTNYFAKAPSAASNVKLGFDAASTNTVVSLGAAVDDLANWNGLVVKGGRVELGYNQSFAGAGVTTLEVDGGILRLAGGSPVSARTLTVEGDATLKGGFIDGGVGVGSSGKLVVGGNIVSDGTVLWGNPDITMNPTTGTKTVDGSAPLYGVGVFTKTGAGTVQLNQEISAQTVVISQGTLLLGNNNRINDDAAVWLSGGTFATGGYSEKVGQLSLKADSVIDFGSGSSVLRFDDSSAIAWTANTITVANWTGSIFGGGTDQLIFGSSSSALGGSQLAKILFSDPYGLPAGTYSAIILPTGEVVPIPEPATVAVVLFMAGGLACRERRQLARGFRALARWLGW
jgi:autotransporter-associated beta strand protein